MNQEPNIIAAIDIGTTKIVAIVGRRTEEGKLRLLGMEQVPSIGVKRGVVLNIDETVASIKQVIAKIEQKTGYHTYRSVCGYCRSNTSKV